MRHVLSATAVASILAVTASASGIGTIKKEDPVQRTLRFAGSGPHTLEVRTISGNVHIEGYDGSEVVMTTTRSTSAQSTTDLEAAQREVTLDVKDGTGTIQAVVRYADGDTCGTHEHSHHDRDWPDYEVRYDFTIRVPRDTRLVVCTINEGHVDVSGTRADFELRSINGPIDFADMGGSGEATTVNGAVKGSFSAPPRADSVFKTINGNIVLTLPSAFAADLRMKTFNGGLYTDFDAQPVSSPPAITSERKGGRTIYQSNSFAHVRVGSGGPAMTLDTLNGDVRILRAAH
ncbi:MAG TPA: hypothetical protein VGQ27_11530 [Steroidobacteraceae bacterium]|jgi:hypothetical protein|nr:hypothetical protein [Steroidobacteraceae bacterium]